MRLLLLTLSIHASKGSATLVSDGMYNMPFVVYWSLNTGTATADPAATILSSRNNNASGPFISALVSGRIGATPRQLGSSTEGALPAADAEQTITES